MERKNTGKKARQKTEKQMKEKVAMIQRTLLGDTDVSELGISALIGGDGANLCNTVLENARKKCRVGPMGRE